MLARLKRRWFIYAAITLFFLIILVVYWERTDAIMAAVIYWILAIACTLFWDKKASAKQARQETGIEAVGYQKGISVSTADGQKGLDDLTVEELEKLSEDELLKMFRAWIERASQPNYPSDHAYFFANKLVTLNSTILNDSTLKWSQDRDENSLESCSEFLNGYWFYGGPLDVRIVKSLFDFVTTKPLDDHAWYLSVLLALATAYEQGAQVEGLKDLLQRYESACRESQPGFSKTLAESLASQSYTD